MLFKSGELEITPDVRSVPLGEKRKKGRPKKLPNCLVKSPIRALPPTASADELDSSIDEPGISVRDDAALDIDDNVLVQQSPVHAILSQSQSLKPGLGSSKPPKKRGKSHKSSEISKDTSKSSGSKPPKKQGKNQNSSDSSSGSNLSNDISEASDSN